MQLRPVDDEALPFFLHAIGFDQSPRFRGKFAHGNGAKFGRSIRGQAVPIHAVVDDGVVRTGHIVVDDLAMAVDGGRLAAGHIITVWIAVVEMPPMNETEEVHTEAKVAIVIDPVAAKGKAVMRDVVATGRQRRPAAIGWRLAPANPGRTPYRVGHPNPAAAPVTQPPPVMKRSPPP